MIIIRRKIIKRRKDSWNHHLFFNRKKTSPIASPQDLVWMKIRGRSEFNLTIKKRQTTDGGVFGGRSVGSYWRRILESQPRWDGDFFVSLSILHSMSFLFTYLMVFLAHLFLSMCYSVVIIVFPLSFLFSQLPSAKRNPLSLVLRLLRESPEMCMPAVPNDSKYSALDWVKTLHLVLLNC